MKYPCKFCGTEDGNHSAECVDTDQGTKPNPYATESSVRSDELLSVYDRFSHMDKFIRDLSDDNKIYATCKALWVAICKEVGR